MGCSLRAAVVVFAVWMVSVTGVTALPAAMVAGEKVAVAPVGRPVTENVIASGKVVPVSASVRLKLAPNPGPRSRCCPSCPFTVAVARLKGMPTEKLMVAVAPA